MSILKKNMAHQYLKDAFAGYKEKTGQQLAGLIKKWSNISSILADYERVKIGMEVCLRDWISDYYAFKMIMDCITDWVDDEVYDAEGVRETWCEIIEDFIIPAKKFYETQQVVNHKKNKANSNEYLKTKETCPTCSGIYCRVNRTRHEMTEKHKIAVAELERNN
jgi:hypothetical protein